MFGNQLAVYGIPVDVFFIPILVFLFAEKNRERGSVLFGGANKQAIMLFKYYFGRGDAFRTLAQKTGDHTFRIS